MLTFNLKKEWFEKIKSGEKTHEYREVKDFWTKRLRKSLYDNLLNDGYFNTMCNQGHPFLTPIDNRAVFCKGYPKMGDSDKKLTGIIKRVIIVNGLETDLKIDKPVYDIEFELKDFTYAVGKKILFKGDTK